MASVINWFEIPVADINRASKFYQQVLDTKIEIQEMMGMKMGFFDNGMEGTGGSICQGDNYKPSMEGTLVYLNGGDDLSIPLSKVEPAGGKVILPKTKVSDDIGFMAMFIDSEGNKIAFHSQN